MCLQDWFNHKNVSCSRRLSKCYFENLLIFIKKSTCTTCEYIACFCIIGMSWMACCITIWTLSLWPKLKQSKVCKLKNKFKAWDKPSELKHIFTQNMRHVKVQWCHVKQVNKSVSKQAWAHGIFIDIFFGVIRIFFDDVVIVVRSKLTYPKLPIITRIKICNYNKTTNIIMFCDKFKYNVMSWKYLNIF